MNKKFVYQVGKNKKYLKKKLQADLHNANYLRKLSTQYS